MADHGQGSRRAQGRPGLLERHHRDRAGEHPRLLRARRRAVGGVAVRRVPPRHGARRPGAASTSTSAATTVQVESTRSGDAGRRRRRLRRRPGLSRRRRPGRPSACRSDVSSAPARATRAATPTSACSPGRPRRSPGCGGFLTVERLRELLPETADLRGRPPPARRTCGRSTSSSTACSRRASPRRPATTGRPRASASGCGPASSTCRTHSSDRSG